MEFAGSGTASTETQKTRWNRDDRWPVLHGPCSIGFLEIIGVNNSGGQSHEFEVKGIRIGSAQLDAFPTAAKAVAGFRK